MKQIFVSVICVIVSFTFHQINCQIFIKSSNSNSNNSTRKIQSSANKNKDAINGFQDGQYFTIANVASGKFLTVEGDNFTRGSNVIAKDWNGDDSQIWLALIAPKSYISSAKLARDANAGARPRFLLIPKRQAYSNSNSNEIKDNEVKVNYTLENLPELTEVLTLDSQTGNLTTEVLLRGSSSQQWLTEDGGNGRIYIRSLGNNQCVKNFDYKPGTLFQKIASFISRLRKPYKPKPEPRPLSTLDCSPTDITQKWVPERI